MQPHNTHTLTIWRWSKPDATTHTDIDRDPEFDLDPKFNLDPEFDLDPD